MFATYGNGAKWKNQKSKVKLERTLEQQQLPEERNRVKITSGKSKLK
jgi:hypothetical protein